jgi:PhnB protein
MATDISPMLAVNDGNSAIAFYQKAFGAEVLWNLNGGVAGLAIEGAKFFLAVEAPAYGTRDPASAAFTTVRIELFVDDPIAVHQQAVSAGAKNHSPVQEREHPTTGPKAISRMLQGAVVDPFGHIWLIGKILS